MDYREKRQCKRVVSDEAYIDMRSLDPQVWHRFWQGVECSVNDISLVGVGVSSKEKLPIGSYLSMDLKLDGKPEKIRVFGKVIWIQKLPDQYKSGISFSWWKDDQDRKKVDNFVEEFGSVN